MKRRYLLLLFMICMLAATSMNVYAHGGNTDGNGGHYDRSNGQYHYHHGYSAHQHPNGICPYEKKSTSNNSSNVISSALKSASSVPTSTPRVFNTVFYVKTATPRPSSTSKIRPAITMAPGAKATATPRPTVKTTSTPRITSTPKATAAPTQRPTTSAAAPLNVADDMSHVWNYTILGGVAFISLCVAIHSSRSRKRERIEAEANVKLQIEIAKAEVKKEYKNKLQMADLEISDLVRKLDEANSRIEQKNQLQNTVAEADQKLYQANAKISDLMKKSRESQHLIDQLKAELKKAKEDALPPQLMYVPPVPDPFPEVGDLHKFYSTHYPTTWAHIQRYALNEYSYLNYYHYTWGNLQINHGDGLVTGKLTDEQRARINYPDPGSDIFISTNDSIHYHNTPNCYTLLGSQHVAYSRSRASRYVPCSKCVKE